MYKIAKLILFGTLGYMVLAPVALADISAGAELSLSQDSNITRADRQEVSDQLTVLSPFFKAVGQRGTRYYSFGYRSALGRYGDSSDDDYADHFLSGDAEYKGRLLGLNLGVDYAAGHDARGSTDSVLSAEPDTWKDTSLGLGLNYGANQSRGLLEFSVARNSKVYTNNRDYTRVRDVNGLSLGVKAGYRPAPRSAVYIHLARHEADYTHTSATMDNVTDTLHVGYRWEITGKTTGSAEIGSSVKTFDEDDVRKDHQTSSWRISLDWQPSKQATIGFSSSSTLADATGLGDSLHNSSHQLSWAHAWSERFNTRLGLGMGQTEYSGELDPDRTDDTRNYVLAADYQMRRWLRFALEHAVYNRSSSAVGVDYERAISSLSVRASF